MTNQRLAAKTDQIFRSFWPINLFTIAVLVVLAVIFWETQTWTPFFLWSLSMLALIVIRVIVRHLYLTEKVTDYRRWYTILHGILFISGLFWGSFALLVFPSTQTGEIIILMIYIGMAATAAVTYTADKHLFWLFILPALGMFISRYFLHPELIDPNAGFLLGLYLVFLLFMNKTTHDRYMRTLDLQLEKDRLIMEMQSANHEKDEAINAMEAVAEEARLIAEKAQATDRFKNRFLANMSHEIRTPLNHIIGLTEFVLENDLDEDSRESMETVVQSARSLLEMVNNLIEFSRLDSYEKNQDLRRTSVQSMINDVLVSENRQVTEHHVEIKTRVSGKIPEIIAVDTQKLKMILSCLIDNAIKFSDDGTVEIETEVERENEDHLMLLFKVSDTGIGIAKENQEKIFESFFQVDSSSTRKHGGTGVGLALAQGLVSFLGGRIWVESELGSGSTFYFTAKVYPSTLEEEDE